MRRLAATLLLLLIFSNTLTPLLLTYSDNPSKTKSFWEKIDDKLIQYAYIMAEKRIFVDYLFIPGVGGGKQNIPGADGLYAILFLLPSIQSKYSEPTEELLGDVINSFANGILTSIANGKGINDVIGDFHELLSQNSKKLGKSVISFYLPYQKIMFRVIAIVWIQAENLVSAGLSTITEQVLGASFDFMKALIDKKLDEIMDRIAENIASVIDLVINNTDNKLDRLISVSSSCTPHYEPIYDDKGNQTVGKQVGYNVEATASSFPSEISNLIKEIRKLVEKIRNLEELGYRNFMDIIENYDDVTEGTKDSEMYKNLFDRLKTELGKVDIKMNEIEEILNNVPSYSKSTWCSSCECETNLKNEVKNRLKNDLIEKLKTIRDNYLKKPIREFLIDNVKGPLSNKLNPLFDEAENMAREIAVDTVGSIASDALTKIPVIGAIYGVANAIHQVFAQTLKDFDYEITLPEGSLIELGRGEVQYFEGKIKDTVPNRHWWQGCIKAAMTTILQMFSSKLGEALNYIPQIFVFDLNFSKSQLAMEHSESEVVSVITGGKPGIYMISGSIKFKNVYSCISDFFGRVGKSLKESSKEKYSIFTEDINNALPESSVDKSGEAVKFAIPYIVASALPVISNIEEIDEHFINIKMAAIMDISSFIKPIINEAKERLEEKLDEGVEAFINEVKKVLNEKICEKIKNFLDEIFKETMEKIARGDSLLGNILGFITEKVITTITNEIAKAIADAITTKIREEISNVLEWIYVKMDIASEKLEKFISITTSAIAIPARGMGEKINITIPALGISESVDDLGYCEISINKEKLIRFSAPVSAVRSYVAFSKEDSIGMIPYSTYSYEPLVVKVFAEFSSTNTFRAKWISDPNKNLPGVSLVMSEMPDGFKLVMHREVSQALQKGNELRYIPNPYPYAEAYVSLNIHE